jgi:carbon-monoxide dehydrogenase medium subunit
MKPAAFEYLTPTSVAAATSYLAELAGEDARILAGGQTLVPAMALRLARPSHLIDINGIEPLSSMGLRAATLHVGACVRHAAFHRPPIGGPLGRLLADVVRYIAHLPIRIRGTMCGSLANADPAAEWSLVAIALGGTMVAASTRGERQIPAAEFFRGFMSTALESDELLVAVELPDLSPRDRFGFVEFSRRVGDFAQAMALVVLQAEDNRLERVRIGIGAVEAVPRRLSGAERCLEGGDLSEESLRRAAEAAAAEVEPAEATEELRAYKRALVRSAVARALMQAVGRSAYAV